MLPGVVLTAARNANEVDEPELVCQAESSLRHRRHVGTGGGHSTAKRSLVLCRSPAAPFLYYRTITCFSTVRVPPSAARLPAYPRSSRRPGGRKASSLENRPRDADGHPRRNPPVYPRASTIGALVVTASGSQHRFSRILIVTTRERSVWMAPQPFRLPRSCD